MAKWHVTNITVTVKDGIARATVDRRRVVPALRWVQYKTSGRWFSMETTEVEYNRHTYEITSSRLSSLSLLLLSGDLPRHKSVTIKLA